jgi:uncharacterized protein YndB with AHSA1/START domain
MSTPIDITDSKRINCGRGLLFQYFTEPELLKRWWPKSAMIEPRVGGAVELIWFNSTSLKTSFSIFESDTLIAYDFYNEQLEVSFADSPGGSIVTVHHLMPQASPLSAIIHVAQTWSFLLTNLQSVIEHHTDLREHDT